MVQCTVGRTRIPCLGGPSGVASSGIPTRSKVPLLTLTASAPIPIIPSHPSPVTTPVSVTDGYIVSAQAPTDADIGCLVRMKDDRVGILRYIGAVRFACGVWGGLELTGDDAMGKNDGLVNGVRYFTCPKQRGLMVPLSKITLIQQEDSDESMVSSSGPHSLLITNKELLNETKTVNQDTTRIAAHDNTFRKSTEVLSENQTYTADKLDRSLNHSSYCNEDANDETLSNNQINNWILKMDKGELDETIDAVQTPPPTYFLPTTYDKAQSTPKVSPRPLSIPQAGSTSATQHFLPLTSSSSVDDPNNKRNSLEFEESLGILTPDQMETTIGSGLMTMCCRSPSGENMIMMMGESGASAGAWFQQQQGDGGRDGLTLDNTRMSCTDPLNNSTSTDLSPSLGIIDENGLAAAFNLKSRTASGELLSLSLDVQQLLHANGRCGTNSSILRVDQTPSPEELPLDPTPVCMGVGGVDEEEEVADVVMMVKGGDKAVRSAGQGSFVASVISITSLDTGYQGDGEMSRPGSRGADNSSSPMTRRPQPRRNVCDPMTDSDFYTESDADCHESDPQNQLLHHHHHSHRKQSGDRRAQVIDGTLYATDAHSSSSAASNGASGACSREPMDSSGVFTDLEGGVADALLLDLNRTIVAASPSDSSTQTITDDSQQIQMNRRGVLTGNSSVLKSSSVKTLVGNISGGDRSGSERSNASPQTGRLISSAKKEDGGSKYSKVGSSSAKKRPLDSKVFKDATNINTRNTTPTVSPQASTATPAAIQLKKQGKWDAVLNKIGKGSRSAEARSLKEVKSRVYNNMPPSAQQVVAGKVSLPSVGEKPSFGSRVRCAPSKGSKGESKDGSAGVKTSGMKPRRILRTRASPSTTSTAKHANVESSINSSLSDLSGASPAKKHGSLKPQRIGSAKTSPRSLGSSTTTTSGGGNASTPPQHSPKTPQQQQQQSHQGNNNNVVNNNNSKNASSSPVSSVRGKQLNTELISRSAISLLTNESLAERDVSTIRKVTTAAPKDTLPSQRHPKHLNNRLIDNTTSSVSPNVSQTPQPNNNATAIVAASLQTNGLSTTTHCSSPPQTRRARTLSSTTTAKTTISPQQSRNAERHTTTDGATRDAVRAAEALAVLVQHLVFEVDAFQAPILKQQVTVMRCDVDTARTTCTQLRNTLREQTAKFTIALDNERAKSKAELNLLGKSHADDLEKVTKQRDDLEHVVQMLNSQMQKLQKIHEERLEILREENDAIRDQLDERNVEILSLQQQQQHHQEEQDKSITDLVAKTPEPVFTESITENLTENGFLTENSYQGDPNSRQEVQSLRAVLDLKQSENGELRKALAEAVRKCDRLPSVEEKLATRTARCEDLDLQLKLHREREQQLQAEMKKLKDSFKEEANQKRRLSQYNEELQWKLQQSKEVITKVFEHTGAEEQQQQQQHLSRSTGLNSSFSEKSYHNSYASSVSCIGALACSPRHPATLDRSNSCRARNTTVLCENSVIETCSSPTSPKVKGVVTKSDSVSYMLDMEESPEVLASRIVRRSFRTNSSNSPLKASSCDQQGWSTSLSNTNTSSSPKQKSPSSNGSARRASSSVGNGGSNVGEASNTYLRSKSLNAPRRTSESACSDSALNNAVTEDEEDDNDDDLGVFWQFNSPTSSADDQKRGLFSSSQSSTPYSHHEQLSKHETYRQQETDDSDEEQRYQLPALPSQGAVLPPPRHLATDMCNSEDDDNSCSSSTSSADRL